MARRSNGQSPTRAAKRGHLKRVPNSTKYAASMKDVVYRTGKYKSTKQENKN